MQVPLKVSLGPVHARRANDEAHVLGQAEVREDLAGLLAGLLILDLAGDAHAAHSGHHHQVLAWDGQVGGHRRAFGADTVLGQLDDDLLASAEALLDRRPIAVALLAPHGFCDALALGKVLGVQVRNMQEAVLSLAEVHERRLDGGFHVGHAGLVDVAHARGAAGALDVQLFQHAVVDNSDATLLSLGGVDQHGFFFHISFTVVLCSTSVAGPFQEASVRRGAKLYSTAVRSTAARWIRSSNPNSFNTSPGLAQASPHGTADQERMPLSSRKSATIGRMSMSRDSIAALGLARLGVVRRAIIHRSLSASSFNRLATASCWPFSRANS